jgi:Ca2+-binding EF-hand superfamily protein
MDERAQSFERADANHDGKLSRDEFAATPRAAPPADAAKAFAVSDLNKDGMVSKAEFLDPNYGALLKAALAAKP